jgi:hypothetical protein
MKRQKNVRAKKFQSKKIVADFIFLPSNFFAVQFFCRPIFLPSNFFAVQFFCRPIFLPSSYLSSSFRRRRCLRLLKHQEIILFEQIVLLLKLGKAAIQNLFLEHLLSGSYVRHHPRRALSLDPLKVDHNHPTAGL